MITRCHICWYTSNYILPSLYSPKRRTALPAHSRARPKLGPKDMLDNFHQEELSADRVSLPYGSRAFAFNRLMRQLPVLDGVNRMNQHHDIEGKVVSDPEEKKRLDNHEQSDGPAQAKPPCDQESCRARQ